ASSRCAPPGRRTPPRRASGTRPPPPATGRLASPPPSSPSPGRAPAAARRARGRPPGASDGVDEPACQGEAAALAMVDDAHVVAQPGVANGEHVNAEPGPPAAGQRRHERGRYDADAEPLFHGADDRIV